MSDEANQDNQNSERKSDNLNKLEKKETHDNFFSWKNLNHTEKTNLVLAITSIISLFLIFFMTCEQNKLSRDALERSDTSNRITRESLEFTKKATLSSDSSTKNSLRISDSSLSLAKKSLEISERNMIAANAPYIKIEPYVSNFDVGEFPKSEVHFTNVGNTPALSFRRFVRYQILPDIKLSKQPNLDEAKEKIIMQPNQLTYSTFDNKTALTEDEYKKFIDEEKFFTIRGVLEYFDIFRNRYTMRFFFVYDFSIKKFKPADIEEGYKYENLYLF